MASGEIQDRKVDLTTCSICFETFRVPKYFPCLHSFCEKCVDTFITSTFQKGQSNNGVSCPVCRVFVKKPDEISVEDWAKCLPVNHLLVSLIDMNESQSGEKLCNACARENETESADSWCVNCSEALCKQCVRSHRRNKVTGFHKLVDINDSDFALQSADVYCYDHPDKKLEAYCGDHSVVCCMSCVMLKHRKCDNVGSVEEAAQSLKDSDKMANIEKSLKGTKDALEILVQSRVENMKKTEIAFGEMKEDVEKLYGELSNHLEQLKAKSLQELATLQKEITGTLDLDNKRDELQCRISAVENDLALYHSHMKYASAAQFLQAMGRLTEQSNDLKEFIRRQQREVKDIDVRFEIDERATEIMQIKQFGEVKFKKNALQKIGDSTHELTDMLSVTPNLTKDRDVGVSVGGVAVVNNNLFIISKTDSKSLELWDDKCTILSSLSVSGYPFGIKMISDTEGMVAIQNTMLTAFKIQDKNILKTKDIKVPVYRDFIFHMKKYFIGSRNRIIVHDSSHNHLRDISVSGTVRYLAARDDTTLCYTMWGGRELYCITLDGAPLFMYSHDRLQFTMGVTVDNSGYIYVCGCDSNNVHQLSHDGKLQRIIFDNLHTQPCSVGFNKQNDKAVVVGSKYVLVYDLK